MKIPVLCKIMKMNHIRVVIILALVAMMNVIACEGPSGSEGSQGPEGPEGPVGPAGEDGSMMYSGEGEPGDDIGNIDDYYLNQNTGELYGPKDADGWGNPIIVLMGEDGADGADGEDGSQIYSGNGVPDASLGVEGDYYLDKDSYELYGPKTSNGWGSPLNLKGADGNANVTRYIFPSHDYSFQSYSTHEIDVTNTEMLESVWLVYLVRIFPSVRTDTYPVPGLGIAGDTYYRVAHRIFNDSPNRFTIYADEGPGEYHNNIYIIRIEASTTEDMTKQKGSIISDQLDISNYEAVAEYYGFYK